MRTTHTKFTEPSNTLGRRVAELDRLDTAILMAAKLGTPLPSAAMIFRALSDASIASAEALENWDVTPISTGCSQWPLEAAVLHDGLSGLPEGVHDAVSFPRTEASSPTSRTKGAFRPSISASLNKLRRSRPGNG